MHLSRIRFSTAVVLAAVVLPVYFLRAQDDTELKPLPRFLRTPRLADRYLSTRDVDDLLLFERVEPVCVQLLKRSGVDRRDRMEALNKLVELRESDFVKELITAIRSVDQNKSPEVVGELATLLPSADAESFRQNETELDELADEFQSKPLRQAIIVSSMVAVRDVDTAWTEAAQSEQSLLELLTALPLLKDESLRADLFERVASLVNSDASDEVRIAAIKTVVQLPGDMRSAFNLLADLVDQRQLVGPSLSAMADISKEHWNEDRVPDLSQRALTYAAELSIAERVTPPGRELLALINELADSLPVSQKESTKQKARQLTVQEFVVAALPEKMEYDQTVLVLQSDRPVRITFRNDDIMPHNFVIGTEPDARVELGLLADGMQADRNALAKGYIPDSPLVMHASKLIQPTVVDHVDFIAPPPGIYPYVCTFPGHWSKMYGAMKVVADAESLQLARAEDFPADDLLGIRKVDWTYEQLAADIGSVASGRSFDNGEKWFKRASCYSCHRVQGAGGLVGPDLTKISEKYKKPEEVLHHIMDPSKAVEDQYASVAVVDADGKVYRGVVIKRTEEELVLQENPLESCTPVVIPIEDIEEEIKSPISPMPEKLLNLVVEQTEVYDLLAYVLSGGDNSDPRFSN